MHPVDRDLLITAIDGPGKLTYFAPSERENGLALKNYERRGNYYAVSAMKHFRDMSTGFAGKDNVFVPNTLDPASLTRQKVVVYVPGFQATVTRLPNDHLVVSDLIIDKGTFESIKQAKIQRLGMYKVDASGDEVVMTLNRGALVTAEAGRQVVIADGGYRSPLAAAEEIKGKLAAVTDRDTADRKQFDMFYAPLTSRLAGGLESFSSMDIGRLRTYSGALANAMMAAKNQKNIVWASEYGGSVILGQALRALENGVYSGGTVLDFKASRHILKMYQATSDTDSAIVSAKSLGIIPSRQITKGKMRSLFVNIQRARNADDPFSFGDFFDDVDSGISGMIGFTGVVLLVAAVPAVAAVLPASVAAGMTATGIACSTYSAVSYIGKKVNSKVKTLMRK